MADPKCLIQIVGMDDLVFIDDSGQYTPNLQEAKQFADDLAAYTFIEKHGLERLARVRHITNGVKNR